MEDEEGISLLETINKKTKVIKESKYSIPAYILTVFIASIWMIFMNPCLMNLLLPLIAILIPYKLYDENSFKKLVVVGIASIILIGLSMSLYHTGVIYDQPSRRIRSEDGRLLNGTVEPVYGDSGTTFNLTVDLSEDYLEEREIRNYSLYANISYTGVEGLRREEYGGYQMEPVEDHNGTGGNVEYYVEVEDLSERLFNHYFSLKRNITYEEGETEGEEDYAWTRTSLGFGPVTLPRTTALGMITLQQSLSTSVFYFLAFGLLWLKKRMDKSVSESTEGLEEKEKELEDSCPECGHLLEGKKECDRCGWVEEPEDEIYDEDGEPDV